MLYLLLSVKKSQKGNSSTVAGNVQNTSVVPNIDKIVDDLEGRSFYSNGYFLMFKNILQTIPKNAAKV